MAKSLCDFHLLLLSILFLGCEVKVDDSYDVVRYAISMHLDIPFEQIGPDVTLEELGATQVETQHVIREIERNYGIKVSSEELKVLGGNTGWKELTASKLTGFIREKGVQFDGGKGSWRNLDG